jgi:hypothetical protein
MVQTVERFVLLVVKEKDVSTFFHPFKRNRVHQQREKYINQISKHKASQPNTLLNKQATPWASCLCPHSHACP